VSLAALSLAATGQPASAQSNDCAREADSIRKAESQLPHLEVAPPADQQIVCITLGTYEYYGPHPFRVLSFPMWIAVANAVIGIVAGVVAARLRPLLPGRQALAYVALVPATMTMIQFGTGFLALDAINTPHPASWLLYLCATASMALAATVAFVALKLVPAGAVAAEPHAQARPLRARTH